MKYKNVRFKKSVISVYFYVMSDQAEVCTPWHGA